MWFALAPLLALLFGLALFFGIRTLLNRLSGWDRIAERFAARQSPPAWQWRLATIGVGAVQYRRCANISAQPEGLYVEVLFIARQRTLCIPWPELRQPVRTQLYHRPAIQVSVGPGTIKFPLDIYSALTATGTASAQDSARTR